MKRLAMAILFLAALRASAQTVSTIEQSYGPYHRPETGGAPAFAISRNGILMAWSEIDASAHPSVHIALLDLNARLISPITVLPSKQAFAPFVASDGDSFLLAYGETALPVDPTGVPSGAARTVPPGTRLRWDGNAYRWWSNRDKSVYVLARDGSLLEQHDETPAQTVAIANGVTASATIHTGTIFCFFTCHPSRPQYDLVWSIGGQTGTMQIEPLSAPALFFDGRRAIVAYNVTSGIEYAILNGPFATTYVAAASSRDDVTPGIACDGDTCIMVSSTSLSDVFGVLFDFAHPQNISVFPIATSIRAESFPQIHALGNGRFLVAYFSDTAGDQRLAGRIITTKPTRRRAAR